MVQLTFAQKNAKQLLADVFAAYGLTSPEFLDEIQKAILDNPEAEASAVAQIRNTDVYKLRFAGNIARREAIAKEMAQGRIPTMTELSESKYLELEDSYKEILKKANVPSQFYSNTSYLAKMIGNDLSTAEVGARASLAQQAANQANPEIKQQLQSMYGISENQITAFFLDPALGAESLGAVAAGNAAILSASASRSGLALSKQQAERLAQQVAPESGQAIDSNTLFAETQRTAGLAGAGISGDEAGVTAEDVVVAATGDVGSQARLDKERQKRQAEYQAASGMAETSKGVVGLQRANL